MQDDLREIAHNCQEPVPGPRDWRFGRETGFVDGADQPRSWVDLLPDPEIQYQRKKRGSLDRVFDTSACVTFSVENWAEASFAGLYRAGALAESQISLLDAHGFLVWEDGVPQLNLSDRDLAARAGTTEDGNSFARVLETLRTVGPIPEADHPFAPDLKTWEEYMVPGPQLQAKRDAWLEVFPAHGGVQYELMFWAGEPIGRAQKLALVRQALASGPVLASCPVCPGWSRYKAKEGKAIEDCGLETGGHATICVDFPAQDDTRRHFDHYEPFVKTLAPDYWLNHAYRARLVPKAVAVPPPKPKPVAPAVSLQLGSRSPAVIQLQACLVYLGYQTVASDPARPYFGDRTREALLAFQRAEKVDTPAKLTALNGEYYGAKTLAALRRVLV